jgi:hypothetical protein
VVSVGAYSSALATDAFSSTAAVTIPIIAHNSFRATMSSVPTLTDVPTTTYHPSKSTIIPIIIFGTLLAIPMLYAVIELVRMYWPRRRQPPMNIHPIPLTPPRRRIPRPHKPNQSPGSRV